MCEGGGDVEGESEAAMHKGVGGGGSSTSKRLRGGWVGGMSWKQKSVNQGG